MAKDSLKLTLDEKGNVKVFNMTREEIKTLTDKKYSDITKAIAESMKKKGCDN